MIPFSEDFSEWSNARTSAGLAAGITDPFGGNNSWLVTQTTASGGSGSIFSSQHLSSSKYYTLSVYAKKKDKDFIVIYDTSATRTYFNLANGTVGTVGANQSNATITAVGSDGWYRVSTVFKPSGSGTQNVAFYLADSDNSTTVTASDGVYLHAAQLEETQYESTPSGNELVTNGTFDTDGSTWGGDSSSGWWNITNPSNSSISDGQGVLDSSTGSTDARQQVSVTAGKSYQISVTMSKESGGAGVFYMSDGANYSYAFGQFNATTTETTFTKIVIPTQTTLRLYAYAPSSSGKTFYDNISVKEISPVLQTYAQTPVILNDGSNTTATTLGEFSGKENLLDYSEDFSNNFWSKIDCTAVASNVADPFGGTGAYKITETGTNSHLVKTSVATTGQVKSIYARTVSGTGVVDVLGANGPKYKVTLTEEWQRFDFVVDTSEGGGNHVYGVDFRNSNTTLTEVLLFGAQLNTNSLKDYQKTTGTALTGDVNVVNWYDQAGGEDFVNATAGEQPRIVMGSELVTDSGGKASVYFDGSERINNDTLSGQNRLDSYFIHDTSDTLFAYPSSRNNSTRYGPFAANGSGSSSTHSNYGTPSFYFNGSLQTIGGRDAYHDNATGHKLITHQSASTSTWSQFSIGMGQSADWAFTGKISEMVFFPNMDSSPKRFPIEQNMLRHFDVNLVTNGTFDTDTDWTKGTGWTIANGIASQSGGVGQLSQSVSVDFNKKYLFEFDAIVTAGTLKIAAGVTAPVQTFTQSGHQSFELAFAGNAMLYILGDSSFAGSIDNVKIQEAGVSGYVTKLFDQTGNNNHALQSTAANQPQIVSGGDVLTAGGKPAMEFDGTNDYLPIASDFNDNLNLNNISSSVVYQPSNTTQQGMVLFLGGSSGGNKRWYSPFIDTTTTKYSYNGVHPASSETSNLEHSVLTFIAGSNLGGFRAYRNGVAKGSGNTSLADNSNDTDKAGIGAYSQGSLHFAGKFQEAVIYDSDQNANRSGIQNNQGSQYGITIS